MISVAAGQCTRAVMTEGVERAVEIIGGAVGDRVEIYPALTQQEIIAPAADQLVTAAVEQVTAEAAEECIVVSGDPKIDVSTVSNRVLSTPTS